MSETNTPKEDSPKKPLNDLLQGTFAALTDKQYLAARNAGYTADELAGKTWHWFNMNEASLKSAGRSNKSEALPKQIQFLESLGYEIEDYQRFYIVLRKAITHHILSVECDERFRRAYEANRKDNESRKYRARPNAADSDTKPLFDPDFIRTLEEMQ